MSLTSAIAMTRENALLERSTESNQVPRPIGIELSDASAEFESSTRSGGALGWERANGGVGLLLEMLRFVCGRVTGARRAPDELLLRLSVL